MFASLGNEPPLTTGGEFVGQVSGSREVSPSLERGVGIGGFGERNLANSLGQKGGWRSFVP
ncbi:MAG: hypothetical protein HN531_14915 [Opitutae bacterium]|nr:hypothetical protein [Opitutae bacterium]